MEIAKIAGETPALRKTRRLHCGDTLDSSSGNTARRFHPPATAAANPHSAAKDSHSAGMARFPVS
jgi:hypothetical protein